MDFIFLNCKSSVLWIKPSSPLRILLKFGPLVPIDRAPGNILNYVPLSPQLQLDVWGARGIWFLVWCFSVLSGEGQSGHLNRYFDFVLVGGGRSPWFRLAPIAGEVNLHPRTLGPQWGSR